MSHQHIDPIESTILKRAKQFSLLFLFAALHVFLFSSSVVSAAAPQTPSNLTATAVSSNRIDLSWTDNSNDERGFLIERKTGATGTYVVIGRVGPDVTTYSSKHLLQAKTYYYRVRAFSGFRYSAYADEASATTLPMNPPSGLTATVVSLSRIDLFWTVNSNDERGFLIERKTGATGTYSVIGRVGPNVTTYSSKHLVPTQTYYYRVRAFSGFTYSAYTNEVSASTGTDVTPPTGSIVLTSATGFTNSTTVNLMLSATDSGSGVAAMQFSNDGSTWSTSEAYALSKSWTIEPGDGAKTVYVRFKDNTDNWSNAIPSNTITLDTIPPSVVITSPATGFTNNKTPLLNYAVSDGTIVVQVDGTVISTVSGSPVGPLPDGPHTLRVESTDVANNTGHAEINFIVDTTPPIVVIASPVAGAAANNAPLLSYTVSDGIVVVALDGVVVFKTSGNHLDALPVGQHTIRVESTDAANNTGFAEVAFTITLADTTPPTTVLSSVPSSPDGANGWFKNIPAITLTSNESGTTYYKWGLDEYLSSRETQTWISNGTPLYIRGDDTGAWYPLPFNFTFYGTSYAQVYLSTNGLLSFAAEDVEYDNTTGLAGRVAIAPLWYDLATDVREGDDIYVFQPDADSIGFRWQAVTLDTHADTNFEVILYRNGMMTFNYGNQAGDVSPTIGISKGDGIQYRIAYDGDISTTNHIDSIIIRPKGWSIYTGPIGALSGENTFSYYSIDSGGNVEAPKDQLFKVDATMPIVSITSPLAGFTNNTTPVLSYTLSKVMSTNTVMVDGAAVNKLSGDALDPLSEGPHTLRVDVTDYAGNTSFAEVTFTVVSFAQSAGILSPAAGYTNNNTPLLSYMVNYGTVTVKVDGAVVNTVSGEHLNMFADGPHMVRVDAVDASGFTTFSEVQFIVDSTPPLASGLPGFIRISAGDSHSAAITSDGNMWWWGYMTEFGYRIAAMPSATGDARAWLAISSGYEGSLSLKSDGSLWGWGLNPFINISNYREFTPARIGDDNDWMSIDAKGSFGLGPTMLKKNGTLWDLGRNRRLDQIGSDADWVAVSNGEKHIVALKSDDTLWAWGSNYAGQLGLQEVDVYDTPMHVGNDTNWSAISAGYYHTVALKSDGTLWAWGNNEYGQLGDGSGVNQYTPIQIGSDTNWSAVSAGDYHTIALKSDGSLWAWGDNECDPLGGGQLGDGSQIDRYTPVRIGSDTNWSAISAGQCYTLALKTDGSLWIWGVNWGNASDDYGYRGGWTRPHNIFSTEDAILINNGSVSTSATAVSLTLNAWDVTSGLAFMKFSNDGVSWSVAENYAHTKTWALSPGDGAKTVYVMFQDIAGNWSSTYSISITLDTVAPTVSITSPVAGLTDINLLLLEYNASEGTVVVRVDGVEVNKASGSFLETLADGFHTVRVEATDAAGNRGYAEVTFTVDAVAPTVALSSPSPGATSNTMPQLMYTISDGAVVVMVDGIVVNKVSGNTLDVLAEGGHTVRVESMDTSGRTGFAEVAFTVDTTPPTVSITSPVSGVTNIDEQLLVYSVSDGTVTVNVDGSVVNSISGGTLGPLSNGSHTVRVEARDAANNTGFAEVTFTVDTVSAGNDDTNSYCMGTGNVLVGQSAFTNGISVPTTNNNVWIASPVSYSTINGTKTIIKGAMDTTLPVNTVSVLVTNSTGSTSYLAQVNGKYFAAQVSLKSGDNTIIVTATDQSSGKHQAIVTVNGTGQTDAVALSASPSVGIPTLKQTGKSLLDAALITNTSLQNPVKSYAWDFNGSGANSLTCYSHPNVNVSYEHVGLYLTTVTLTDTTGNKYKDTAIVNVVDATEMISVFKTIWSRMKTALLEGNITAALTDYSENTKSRYQQIFTQLISANTVSAIYLNMMDIVINSMDDQTAECWALRQESDGIHAYPITFVKDSDGVWKIMGY